MSQFLDVIKKAFTDRLLDCHSSRGDDIILVARENLLEIARHLKDDPELGFEILLDMTAVDYPEDEDRFEVVYHFLSLQHNHRLRLKLRLNEDDPEIPSLVDIWPGANWLEREVWDMFGIRFKGHPDLRRILLYEEFEGHPLRKDYPYDKRQPIIGPKN